MKTCYLHLGMVKTGSSSIQSALFGYEDERIAYANLSERNHQIVLSAIFSKTPTNFQHFKKMGITKDEAAKRVAGMRRRFENALKTDKNIIFLERLSLTDLTLTNSGN